MKKIYTMIFALFLVSLFGANTYAGTIVVSSDNLNISDPFKLLSNPTTTLQVTYDFNLYHKRLYMDIRARTKQQSAGETIMMDTDNDIIADKITILPSVDAGVRVKLLSTYRISPYIFSIINYTLIKSSMVYQNYQMDRYVSALGLRTGMGINILFQSKIPSFLYNMDVGYQYLPIIIADINNINLNGLFFNIGFGLSF